MHNRKYVDYQRICEDGHARAQNFPMTNREFKCGLIVLLSSIAVILVFLILWRLFPPHLDEATRREITNLIFKTVEAISKAIPN
jgi:hypothetical protein